MKIFNEIRPEEIESGFQQPEPGYEGFILKPTDTYPGNYPRYEEPLPPEPIYSDIPEVAEGIIDAASLEGDIWGAFDQEQPLPEKLQQTDDQIQIPTEQQIEAEPVIEQEVVEDPFAEISNEVISADTTPTGEESSTLSVDDELRKLLEEELARSAEKKAKKQEEANSDEIAFSTELQEKPEFIPVEESGAKVDFIDMMAIDPSRPKVDLTPEAGTEPMQVIPEKKSKTKQKKEKIKPPKKEKGEKKPKGVLFWILSSVAGLLIISTLSYFAFNYYLKSNSNIAKNDSTLAHKDSVHHNVDHKKETHKPKEEVHKDTTHQIEEHTNVITPEPEIVHNEPKKLVSEEKIHPTANKVAEPKKVVTTTEIHTPKPITKRAIPQTKQEKKSDIATNVPATTPVEVPQQTTEKQIYTIQVYATPSFEDAEFWRQKLTSMRINDVYISTQKVRDIIWYRVRFGKFNNRQQALDVAKQFGFSQTWVDRIQ